MPEDAYTWLPRSHILNFRELARVARLFSELGAHRVRLTGGEPLLRSNLENLIEMLAATEGIDDIALTTNGVLLAAKADSLKRAGLHRLTISLDTLRGDRFTALTRRDQLDSVLRGIDAAQSAAFGELKIDTVVIRGLNDDELPELLAYAHDVQAEIRFIEYMDVGGATRWHKSKVVSRTDILDTITKQHGPVTPLGARGSAPAERFRLPSGQVFGIIASATTPFCSACDRSRLTADGQWYRCLYASQGTDLKTPLRAGATDDQLRTIITQHWSHRTDRGAEERTALSVRQALVPASALRRHPHLEMHTRGG